VLPVHSQPSTLVHKRAPNDSQLHWFSITRQGSFHHDLFLSKFHFELPRGNAEFPRGDRVANMPSAGKLFEITILSSCATLDAVRLG
jgi:hypothetical protein